ncbi:FadR/GntR family transcriptional regulator [Saccharopolyspora sp. NPDC049357]|uniref:FadR/GntR family transcriptional regulator n=1 Tax=Saccharopolyspora sp. NPDC049357 TaxID=3154507 RepID=UPI00342EDDA7
MTELHHGEGPGAALWSPIRDPGSLSERIASQVEALIQSEQLQPGDKLPPERQLAELLGVSRPSLREAIRSLSTSGRVTVRHGQGVFVEPPATTRLLSQGLMSDDHDTDELYAMREILEVPAAGLAAENADAGKLDLLQRAFDELLAATQRDDLNKDELQKLDAQFHLTVVRLAGNRFLLRTLGVLNDVMAAGMETTLVVPGRITQSTREHARIIEAIKAGNANAARRAARQHIRNAHATSRKQTATSLPEQ